MTITFRPEQEHIVCKAIESGLIETAHDVVDVGVETIRQRLQLREIAGAARSDIDAAANRLLTFGEKYRFSLDGMTSKDLVNEGRR
jgi:hypothetical protein